MLEILNSLAELSKVLQDCHILLIFNIYEAYSCV